MEKLHQLLMDKNPDRRIGKVFLYRWIIVEKDVRIMSVFQGKGYL